VVQVAIRPGETIEISSPARDSFGGAPERSTASLLSGAGAVPAFPTLREPITTGNAEDAEKRRIEIASLRQEVASLLKMNSSLHTRLNQANVSNIREPTSASASFANNLDASASSHVKAPLVWLEERRSLEERAAQLTEECRVLESEKVFLEASSSASTAAAEPPAVAVLLRSRDDMRQRLQATEQARCAAEHRLATAEAALARSRDELAMRKQRQHGAMEEARFGPWLAEEVKSLRRELSQEQAKLDDVSVALARRNEQVTKAEKDQAEAKIEYDALVAANEALRKDIASMKEKIDSDRQGSRSAEAELGEMQAQCRLRELDLNSELQEAKARAKAADDSICDRRAALQASEASAAAAKAEGLELQSQVEVLRAAHDELLKQEEREAAEHEDQAAQLKTKASTIAADKAELEKHLEEVEAATRELQASELECQKKHENTMREVNDLRSRSSDMARRSQEAMAQAEQRIQALLQQLSDERQQNLELEREISIAREAAGEVASAPWEIAQTRSAGKPRGWASTALQMHRELELLQRWKNEALDTFRRMQGDMDTAQQQYQQQLHHNQGLQERLESMGHQAKAAVAAFSTPGLIPNAASEAAALSAASAPAPPSFSGSLARAQPFALSVSAASAAVLEADSLPKGPDVPEPQDLPAHLRSTERRPVASGALNFAALGPTNARPAAHGVATGGPVGGPFYDAFRTRQPQPASRLAARGDTSSGRCRRSGSAGRSSSTPVVAPLLVNRPLSAGSGNRRR
jgi:DNA repair exonuclease SbcCD ATPase subunit